MQRGFMLMNDTDMVSGDTLSEQVLSYLFFALFI